MHASNTWGESTATLSREDELAYEQSIRAANVRVSSMLFASIALALLLWWPLDAMVFRGQGNTREVFSQMRPLLSAMAAALFVLLRFVPVCRQYPRTSAALGGAILVAVLTNALARLSGPSGRWFEALDLVLLSPALFAGPVSMRLGVGLGLEAVAIVGYFGLHSQYLADPMTPYALSFMTFCVLVGIGGGALAERLRRQAFFLRRELEREASKLESRVREQTLELRALTAYNESARESERTHIARELHDELGQELTGIRYALSLAQTRFEQEPSSIAANLRELEEHLQRTAQTAHNIVLDLRPRVLDDLGLVAAAEWLVRRTQERTGIECHLDVSTEIGDLSGPIATAAFRILQEALTNVSRHARATQANVTICSDAPDWLLLRVTDNGIGLEASRRAGDRRQGMGLIGMRERVRALDGEIAFSEGAQGATTVEVKLPLGGTTREGAA